MDGLNEYRTVRVAEVLSDFRTLQYYIAAAPVDPTNPDDYYTEGWAALRQCALDGRHILNVSADVTVPQAAGGEDEQARAELQQCVVSYKPHLHPPHIPSLLLPPWQDKRADEANTRAFNRPFLTSEDANPWFEPPCRVHLDSYARRHEAQKIYLRQAAAQRWVEYREQALQGQRPSSSHRRQLRACDEQLRRELQQITDDAIYQQLRSSDMSMGRWTAEDPSLRAVQRWLRARPQTT
ncbi:hypothetical protein DL766_006068 [Monosporascus sp. MC13-8B]|uniref:Uncharacterized protein n=1 Tax=Monosporascus cannonballus TaxID=155416 RepID=A0ABY0GRC9_9PEZI|nr:hypothetical protein DL762_010244 [Monosporascus cannonballus]RYP28075.1 hypothetical protein DL766_006068 [Monosporascus sp. MC13-8B]